MEDQISRQIERLNACEPGAQEALFAAAYGELRKLARCRLYESGRSTSLDTIDLVNESYLRFVTQGPLRNEHRGAFFAYASRVMRSVIVDAARARQSERRGGDSEHLRFDTQMGEGLPGGEDELAWVHEALEVLARAEPRLARVVEMRYFGGYSEIEIAESLGVTDRTVRRDWDKARLLLSTLMRH